MDFGGLDEEQQGGGVELGDSRQAVDRRRRAGCGRDRRLDPALGKRYRLVEDLALDVSWGFSL